MTTEPPVRAADRAHAHLRDEILHGRVRPGTMLSENELAATLSMSRTPVRTALSRLQEEGWVTIYPQRGALVRELSEQEVREAADVRHALETAGVERGSPRRREEHGTALEANLAEQDAALSAGDFATFTRLAMTFHRGFVQMAGNAVMLTLYDRLQDWQLLSIVRSSERIVGDPAQVLGEHRALLEAGRTGDWTAFAALLDEHQARSHGMEGPAA
jgi:DNA-binding GntR family transcriptional regulator